ncbi:MAG: ParB/RepB/Spo0J family partition protein [Planctomycetota bacterium]
MDFFLSGGRNSSAPTPPAAKAPAAAEPEAPAGSLVQQVPLDGIEPNPFQPRKDISEGELKSLADSIKASGILQPILAREVGGKIQIVAGERRWRAARLAGLTEVPVIVRPLSDQDSAVFALVENVQREDLNAIEKAQGIKLLMDQMKATQEQVAKQVGFERSTVANFLRLLDLPAAVQAHVSRGTLSMGHARCLLALPDEEIITKTADLAIQQGWSVRVLEAKVKEMLEATVQPVPGQAPKPAKGRPVWLNELEESLVESLGTTVAIKYGRKKSQIVIECVGREEFERIFQRLKN